MTASEFGVDTREDFAILSRRACHWLRARGAHPFNEDSAMDLINIGGRMPDGVKVQEFWIDESEFVCASGAALQIGGKGKRLMGKLCLTTRALIMLPYEGLWLKVGEWFIKQMQSQILGDYADLADLLEDLGVVDTRANYDKLAEVLVIPLAYVTSPSHVTEHQFLFVRGGASLTVFVNGQKFEFQMATRGSEVGNFASAQDFAEAINYMAA